MCVPPHTHPHPPTPSPTRIVLVVPGHSKPLLPLYLVPRQRGVRKGVAAPTWQVRRRPARQRGLQRGLKSAAQAQAAQAARAHASLPATRPLLGAHPLLRSCAAAHSARPPPPRASP